jgi:long-chain fatty acid transport protein
MGIFQAPMSDKLSSPAEMGIGASYSTKGHTIAFDYKQIKWSDASGYKDFGWDDQDVYAVGYEYTTQKWALRLGYNYASNPIGDAGAVTMQQGGRNMSMYAGNALNMFNLLGFPATVESHYAIGGTYAFTKTTSLDIAYTYAPETETTLRTMPDMVHGADVETTVKHSQQALSLQLNYLF